MAASLLPIGSFLLRVFAQVQLPATMSDSPQGTEDRKRKASEAKNDSTENGEKRSKLLGTTEKKTDSASEGTTKDENEVKNDPSKPGSWKWPPPASGSTPTAFGSFGATTTSSSSNEKNEVENDPSKPGSWKWPTSFGSSTSGTATFGSSSSTSSFGSGTSASAAPFGTPAIQPLFGAAPATSAPSKEGGIFGASASSTPAFGGFSGNVTPAFSSATAPASSIFSSATSSSKKSPKDGGGEGGEGEDENDDGDSAAEVVTGEEGEELVLQFRARLFRRSTEEEDKATPGGHASWVEIGRGPLRMLRPKPEEEEDDDDSAPAAPAPVPAAAADAKDDPESSSSSSSNKNKGPRVVMRQEQKPGGRGLRLLLNVGLRQQACRAQRMGAKAVLLSFVEPQGARSYLVQCKGGGGNDGAHADAMVKWVEDEAPAPAAAEEEKGGGGGGEGGGAEWC